MRTDLARRVLRSLARLATSLALLAAAALAQDPAPGFDPVRDLEGWDEANFSTWAGLYDLAPFEAAAGTALDEAALAALRDRWRAERARVAARVASIEADPRERRWFEQERELARSEAFAKTRFLEARAGTRARLLVEVGVDGDRARRIADDWTPWIAKVEQVFDARYAKPLALARRPEAAADTVVLLAGEESYRAWSRAANVPQTELAAALWSPGVGVVVGYEDDFLAAVDAVWRRYPVLREHVRALCAAHVRRGAGLGSLWLEEGLASYLAWHAGETPAALDARAIDAGALAALVEVASDPAQREVLVGRLAELVDVASTRAAIDLAERHAESRGEPAPPWTRTLRTFYAQSALWMHFLQHAGGGRWRSGFEAYLRSAFAGDARAFELEYWRYVWKLHQEAFPAVELDASAPEVLSAPRAAPGPAAARRAARAANVARVAPATAPDPAFSPAQLAPEEQDLEAQHALALALARAGDLEGAAAKLAALGAMPGGGVEAERIARDLARVRELAKLRDGWFESLRQTGKPWVTQWKGRALSTGIERIEDGWLHLRPNQLGLAKIRLAEVDPYAIARQAARPEERGGAAAWARAYAYALAGDEKWDKLAKDDSPEAAKLREDVSTWLPDLLRGSRCANALAELARTRLPLAPRDAKAVAERIRALLELGRGTPILERKLAPLRQLALHALAASAVEVEARTLAHGAWAEQEGGVVRLTYDFADPAQAQDFARVRHFVEGWKTRAAEGADPAGASPWKVADGELAGVGLARYRHYLVLSAPIRVRWRVRFDASEAADPTPPRFSLSVCDDGEGSAIECADFGDLSILDRDSGFQRRLKAPDFAPTTGVRYEFELVHDGSTVTTSIDGEKRQSASCGPRRTGSLHLTFQTQIPIAIEELEIEGVRDAAAIEAARAEAMLARLRELGFS